MKVGDLVAIGCSGNANKEPYVAVITQVHCITIGKVGYTVFIPATGKEAWLPGKGLRRIVCK